MTSNRIFLFTFFLAILLAPTFLFEPLWDMPDSRDGLLAILLNWRALLIVGLWCGASGTLAMYASVRLEPYLTKPHRSRKHED